GGQPHRSGDVTDAESGRVQRQAPAVVTERLRSATVRRGRRRIGCLVVEPAIQIGAIRQGGADFGFHPGSRLRIDVRDRREVALGGAAAIQRQRSEERRVGEGGRTWGGRWSEKKGR